MDFHKVALAVMIVIRLHPQSWPVGRTEVQRDINQETRVEQGLKSGQ